MSSLTPTQRSLAWLREQGYLCEVVEHWNAHARVRKDLFGFVDILAIDSDARLTMAVQTTSGSNMAARVAKIRANPNLATVLAAGWKIEVHGWRKIIGEQGRKIWQVRVEVIA